MPIVIHVPLFNKSFDYEMTAEAINIEYHDWVFSCKSDERTKKHWYSRNLIVCNCNLSLKTAYYFSLVGRNWSSNSTISVSKHLKRRHITLKLLEVYKLGHSNLVFKIKNTKKSVNPCKL